MKEKKKGKLRISKRLAERIQRIAGKFDSDCKFCELNTEILEKQMPDKIALVLELINGGLEDLFSAIQGNSFDVGFVMGYAVAQISDVPDRRFKATIEDVKKLIMDRGALSKT